MEIMSGNFQHEGHRQPRKFEYYKICKRNFEEKQGDLHNEMMKQYNNQLQMWNIEVNHFTIFLIK